jgi:hypothetical protein
MFGRECFIDDDSEGGDPGSAAGEDGRSAQPRIRIKAKDK